MYIEKEFTEDKIKKCLMECNGDKAPGPGGFNMGFLQKFCHVLKDNVLALFEDFHKHGFFVKSLILFS